MSFSRIRPAGLRGMGIHWSTGIVHTKTGNKVWIEQSLHLTISPSTTVGSLCTVTGGNTHTGMTASSEDGGQYMQIYELDSPDDFPISSMITTTRRYQLHTQNNAMTSDPSKAFLKNSMARLAGLVHHSLTHHCSRAPSLHLTSSPRT